MRFLTFQPKFVLDVLISGNDYYPAENYYMSYNVFKSNPIFCIKCSHIFDVLKEMLVCCPSYPQVAIVFDTDDYIAINKLDWYKHLEDSNEPLSNKDGRKEYVVSVINSSSLVGSMKLCSDLSVSVIQDTLIQFQETSKMCDFIRSVTFDTDTKTYMVDFENTSEEIMNDFASLYEMLNFQPTSMSVDLLEYFYTEVLPKMFSIENY